MGVHLDFKRPPYTILEEVVSESGKYLAFYGVHFEKGITCYVVGVCRKSDACTDARHYNEGIPGCVAPKAQSASYWEEFKTAMKGKSENHGSYETDEESENLARWFDRAAANRKAN